MKKKEIRRTHTKKKKKRCNRFLILNAFVSQFYGYGLEGVNKNIVCAVIKDLFAIKNFIEINKHDLCWRFCLNLSKPFKKINIIKSLLNDRKLIRLIIIEVIEDLCSDRSKIIIY